MGLRTSIQKRLQASFNISRWVNYTYWRNLNQALIQSFREVFTWQALVDTPSSFETVARQLQLNEADLRLQQQWLWRLTQWCLGIFGLLVGYLIYLVVIGAWWSVIPSAVLALMLLCQAFRYHFWCFQITQRRLGCRLQTWYQVTFLGREVPHD